LFRHSRRAVRKRETRRLETDRGRRFGHVLVQPRARTDARSRTRHADDPAACRAVFSRRARHPPRPECLSTTARSGGSQSPPDQPLRMIGHRSAMARWYQHFRTCP
jgi:hypothetical protein